MIYTTVLNTNEHWVNVKGKNSINVNEPWGFHYLKKGQLLCFEMNRLKRESSCTCDQKYTRAHNAFRSDFLISRDCEYYFAIRISRLKFAKFVVVN